MGLLFGHIPLRGLLSPSWMQTYLLVARGGRGRLLPLLPPGSPSWFLGSPPLARPQALLSVLETGHSHSPHGSGQLRALGCLLGAWVPGGLSGEGWHVQPGGAAPALGHVLSGYSTRAKASVMRAGDCPHRGRGDGCACLMLSGRGPRVVLSLPLQRRTLFPGCWAQL